jgi:hypothetical protein
MSCAKQRESRFDVNDPPTICYLLRSSKSHKAGLATMVPSVVPHFRASQALTLRLCLGINKLVASLLAAVVPRQLPNLSSNYLPLSMA